MLTNLESRSNLFSIYSIFYLNFGILVTTFDCITMIFNMFHWRLCWYCLLYAFLWKPVRSHHRSATKRESFRSYIYISARKDKQQLITPVFIIITSRHIVDNNIPIKLKMHINVHTCCMEALRSHHRSATRKGSFRSYIRKKIQTTINYSCIYYNYFQTYRW